jgi:choline monooxygenase
MIDQRFIEDCNKVLTPGEPGYGLPNSAYLDNEIFALEQETVFAKSWTCIGFEKDVPNVKDVYPLTFFGQPIFMARSDDGTVRVFHNVCSHRGMILVDKSGPIKGVIRCPYHSWCYEHSGVLKSTPFIGGPNRNTHPEFDPSDHGLKEIRSVSSFGLVFVNLDGNAPDFNIVHADFLDRWSEFKGAPLCHGGPESTLEFTLKTNWKLAVENYCEAYHLPWVHPDLNRYSKIEDHYNINQWGCYSGQGTTVYSPTLIDGGNLAFPAMPGLLEKWDSGAEYIALYPNVLLGVHKDHYFAILITPDGPHQCHERVEIFYFDEVCLSTDFASLREANSKSWQTVFAEDVGVVEGMQRGRSSSGFNGGVFTPVLDTATRCFHMWVADRYIEALKPPGGNQTPDQPE